MRHPCVMHHAHSKIITWIKSVYKMQMHPQMQFSKIYSIFFFAAMQIVPCARFRRSSDFAAKWLKKIWVWLIWSMRKMPTFAIETNTHAVKTETKARRNSSSLYHSFLSILELLFFSLCLCFLFHCLWLGDTLVARRLCIYTQHIGSSQTKQQKYWDEFSSPCMKTYSFMKRNKHFLTMFKRIIIMIHREDFNFITVQTKLK